MVQYGLVWCFTSTDRQGHLCKVVVVQVENSQVLQARESSRVHTADSVLQEDSIDIDEDNHEVDEKTNVKIMRRMMRWHLSQVELLHPDEVGEDAGAELLDEVLPQGEDGDRLQSVKRPVGHLRAHR